MIKDFTAHFTIQNGRIVWKNQAYMDLNVPKYEGKSGMLQIKVKKSKRSLDQNALMWVWLEEIASYTGHTAEEIHHIFKGKFAPRKTVTLNGKTYTVPRGTSELNVSEMIGYMMAIEAEAAQMGIVLPVPDQQEVVELIN